MDPSSHWVTDPFVAWIHSLNIESKDATKNEGLNFYIILLHTDRIRGYLKKKELTFQIISFKPFMDEKTKAVKERKAHNRKELVNYVEAKTLSASPMLLTLLGSSKGCDLLSNRVIPGFSQSYCISLKTAPVYINSAQTALSVYSVFYDNPQITH